MKNKGLLFIVLSALLLLIFTNCSWLQGDDLNPAPADVSLLVQEIMHKGDLTAIDQGDDDPRAQLLGLMNFFLNEEDGQKVFQGHGLGIRPTISGNYCSAVRGVYTNYRNIDAYSTWMGPDLTVVMPHIYSLHQRTYYSDVQKESEETYTNIMASLTTPDDPTTGTAVDDVYRALADNIFDFEFTLNPTYTYFNVYKIGIDEIMDIRDDLANEDVNFLYQDNFDYIEIALLRDHCPADIEDGIGFLQNQLTFSLFIGLVKDDSYVKIDAIDSYSMIVRLVDLTSGGKFVGIIYGTEDQTGDTILLQLDDFMNYIENNFQPVE